MIYSIGYQRLTVERLIEVMKHLRVVELIDCREKPVSRKAGFSRGPLEQALIRAGFLYTPAGGCLGGRGNVTPHGLSLLRTEARENRNVMLLCMEEAPGECHRHHDIAVPLLERGVDVMHVCDDELFRASALKRAFDEDTDYECEELTI